MLDALGSEALEECVEPSDGEGDPACARLRRVRLDEEPGALVDLPEQLFPDAKIWGSPEEARVPIGAGVEIGNRYAGEEVGDRAHLGHWYIARRGQPPEAVASRAALLPQFSQRARDAPVGGASAVRPEKATHVPGFPSAGYLVGVLAPRFGTVRSRAVELVRFDVGREGRDDTVLLHEGPDLRRR